MKPLSRILATGPGGLDQTRCRGPKPLHRGYAEGGDASCYLGCHPCPSCPFDPEARQCPYRPDERNDGDQAVDDGGRSDTTLHPVARHRHISDETRDARDREDRKEDRAVFGVSLAK